MAPPVKNVTGPSGVRAPQSVYIGRLQYRSPGVTSLAWPNPTGNLFWEDQGEVEGDPTYFQFNGTKTKVHQGRRQVVKAIDEWNEAAGREVLDVTHQRAGADVIVRQGPEGQRSWGYPVGWAGEDKAVARLSPPFSADVAAHELGHTQGLKHLNQNPKPGVMRYGTPGMVERGGGEHRTKPTPAEGTKVVKKQAGREAPWGANPAKANADKFNKAASKQTKKRAKDRLVTGGHKVMQ